MSGILRRRAMMAGGASAPMVRVQYLQSSGSQYIDTGIKPTKDFRYVMTGEFPNTSGATRFGGRYAAYQYENCVDTSSNKFTIRWWNGTNWTPNVQKYAKVIELNGQSKQAKITFADDSVQSVTMQPAATGSTPANFYLFAINNSSNSTVLYSNGMKMEGGKLYESGVLIMDVVPVRFGTVGYMYDQLNDVVLPKYGVLIVGPDV